MRSEKCDRVVVAMSGGVDSSVAAALLVRQGYEVVGVTMNLWHTDIPIRGTHCCSLESAEDAYRVARKLGFEHHHLDFRKEFEEYVVRHFIKDFTKYVQANLSGTEPEEEKDNVQR